MSEVRPRYVSTSGLTSLAAVAQLVERAHGKGEVMSSKLIGGSIWILFASFLWYTCPSLFLNYFPMDKPRTNLILFCVLIFAFLISMTVMMDYPTAFRAFNYFIGDAPHLYADRLMHVIYILIFGLTVPVLVAFWARHERTKKPYLVYLGLLFLYGAPLIFGALGCSGESCMIWMMMPAMFVFPVVVLFVLQLIGWGIVKLFKVEDFRRLIIVFFGILVLAWLVFGLDKLVFRFSYSVDYYTQRAIENVDPSECGKVVDVFFDERGNSNSMFRCLDQAEDELMEAGFCDRILDLDWENVGLDSFRDTCLAKIIIGKGDLSLCDEVSDDSYKPDECFDDAEFVKSRPLISGTSSDEGDDEVKEIVIDAGGFLFELTVPGDLEVSSPADGVYDFPAPAEIGDGFMGIQYNSLSTFLPENYEPYGAKLVGTQIIAGRTFYKYYTNSADDYPGMNGGGFPYTVYAVNSGEGMLLVEIYDYDGIAEYFEDILFGAVSLQ